MKKKKAIVFLLLSIASASAFAIDAQGTNPKIQKTIQLASTTSSGDQFLATSFKKEPFLKATFKTKAGKRLAFFIPVDGEMHDTKIKDAKELLISTFAIYQKDKIFFNVEFFEKMPSTEIALPVSLLPAEPEVHYFYGVLDNRNTQKVFSDKNGELKILAN